MRSTQPAMTTLSLNCLPTMGTLAGRAPHRCRPLRADTAVPEFACANSDGRSAERTYLPAEGHARGVHVEAAPQAAGNNRAEGQGGDSGQASCDGPGRRRRPDSPELETAVGSIAALIRAVERLEISLPGEVDGRGSGARLRDSVLRPLLGILGDGFRNRQATRASPDAASPSAQGDRETSGDQCFALAREATTLLTRHPFNAGLGEAVAALQDLALQIDPDRTDDRLSELVALQAGLDSQILVADNGPYLVTNPTRVVDHLGVAVATRPQMTLCRCGGSSIKPLCDGTHAINGFRDAKSPKRVDDRRDAYVGLQVAVLDNRGICQHAGHCGDRLASVFRAGVDPFVAPSAGRMDEIIRAVRDCPSGALSYAMEGVEARDDVDWHGTREPAIQITKDGPYRVTGAIPLVDEAGEPVARNEGASREHYALCRCGSSFNKPFCSGMHWYVEFRDPVPDPDRTPTLFEWAGGLPALTRMTRMFYEKHVPEDPLLAPLFGSMAADHPQRVAAWLAEVFGGPKDYSQRYGGYQRMISQHLGKQITEEHRVRWVAALLESAREAGLPNDPEFRSVFLSYIEWGSRLAVENSQIESHPPEHMPMPSWGWNTAAGPPGSRVSALAPTDEGDEPHASFPPADQPLSFAAHIKPLFRRRDRSSMQFAFDLWSHADVARHADAILDRVRAGTMPCDGNWPPELVAAFERWVTQGTPE
jgi:CDGSH-type Zn-finger protein/truncated hemoglobin YjbI